MNKFENWFCGSAVWRFVTERKLLPWILSGYALGDHVLEVGAGPGATTAELQRRAGRVTSLEYDPSYVAKLAERHTVIAVLVLHHLKSPEQQNAAFQEFHRVLRPGGMFFAFEIRDGWLQRAGHIRSTFVPVSPASAFARLTIAGFSRIAVDIERRGFRVCALRAMEA